MVRRKKRVIWSEKAIGSLRDIHYFIKQDSEQAAKKVVEEIFKSTRELGDHPEMYQLDELYPNNPGTIRRIFRWSYRIIYEVGKDTIDILNVLHTSQEPDEES